MPSDGLPDATLQGFALGRFNDDDTVRNEPLPIPSDTFRSLKPNDDTELLSSMTVGRPAGPVQPSTTETNQPKRIGNFQIEATIASGGMGTVYKAKQLHPVTRTVALKMIRMGMADEATIQRFHAERQALALMDHEDIAKIYEADTSSDGHPYFAMEYCDGLPITKFCEQHDLDVSQRIELVIRVARAVQSAHRHGIVHRDLKPDNILVSYDAEQNCRVKIIDFGIAKFSGCQGLQKDMTQIGELVGTPAYMSPEQAAGTEIDGRTDVFAIGAILYQLLTGSTPLLPPDGNPTLITVIKHIQAFEPVIPSRRAEQRGVPFTGNARAAKKWIQQIRGDLDWINLKAIQPERTDRYATPDDFADDLRRHLSHEPTLAAAPTASYRLNKYYKKHKKAVWVSAIFFVTLLLFTAVIGSMQWNQYRAEKRIKNQVIEESNILLDDAEDARLRAGLGGVNQNREFTSALTAVAKAESLLQPYPEETRIQAKLTAVQQSIQQDKAAFELVKNLDEARERATQIDGTNKSLFGRSHGLLKLHEAFQHFDIEPGTTPVDNAYDKLAQCPREAMRKIIEALDFLINEEPVGAGIYLHESNGALSVARLVSNGPAYKCGDIKIRDRLLKIDDVDLMDHTILDPLSKAYELLTLAPGKKLRLTLVRPGEKPFTVELTCKGDAAFWANQLLQKIDPDPWRMKLRKAVLSSDLGTLKQLAGSQESLRLQKPFSLIQLASMLFLMERSPESIELLNLCQRNHPDNFWANHYLGTALRVADESPQAGFPFLIAAVALRPQSVGARVNLAHAHLVQGELQSAIDHYEIANQLAPDNEELALRTRTLKRDLLTTRSEAAPFQTGTQPKSTELKTNNEGHRLTPAANRSSEIPDSLTKQDLEYWEAKARAFAQQGQRRLALETVEQAGKALPDHPLLARVKGVVFIDLEDYTAARVVLSDAAILQPGDAATRFYHGIALQYSGDSQSAIHEYQAALQLRPDYVAVKQFLDPLLVNTD